MAPAKKRIFLRIFEDHFEFGTLIVEKEDFLKLYKQNTIQSLSVHYGICSGTVKKITRTWQINRPPSEAAALCKKTKLLRYGDANYNNIEKAKQTARESGAYVRSAEKGKQTKYIKYGDANYNNQAKNKQTCLERYGVENVFAASKIKEKIKATSIERHGVSWPSQSEATLNSAKQTFLDKFNSTSYLGSSADLTWREKNKQLVHEIRVAANKKILEEDPDFFKNISKKVCATKRVNHTFNTSKIEELYYDQFCAIFGKDCVLRQYSDQRYPYNCDFYIKSQDLFIEINYYWTHGSHPFNAACEADLEQLSQIKQKQNLTGRKNSYWTAESVWTQKDPQKLKCAELNNLNYMRIYPEGVYYDKQTEIKVL